jgi:mRNA interferase RelE/StbE
MIYSLEFKPKALKEWKKLDHSIKLQLQKKLKERLLTPRVAHSKLSGFPNVYKIKLRSSGFRLAYEVIDEKVIVMVLSVGKRADNAVYNEMEKRMGKK